MPVGASEQSPGSTVASIGVLDGQAGERRTVISCPSEQTGDIAKLTRSVRAALSKSKGHDKRAMLIAIAAVARELYNEVEMEES